MIYHADDDEDSRKFVGNALAGIHDLTQFEKCRDVLEALRKQRPELLIQDLCMGGCRIEDLRNVLEGTALSLRVARAAIARNVPVLVFTNLNPDKEILTALRGIGPTQVEWLKKGTVEDLQDTVKKLLRRE
jgi:CheY-like chemotaxis protein